MTLNGTLEDFSPAGILKVLSADGRTGAVRFGGSDDCTVYLHRGQLYFARSSGTDEALATALVRPGRLTAEDWRQAIETAGDRPMVGESIVRRGVISTDLLASVVLSVVYDPLIDLFRNGSGEFDFEADTVHWLGPFRAFPVDAIVEEVRKRVREVDEWSDVIPDLRVWVEAKRTLPGNAAQVTILREDWELVTALTRPRTIEDLATELGRGSYSTARVVHRLQQAGLVAVAASNGHADVVPIRRRPEPIEGGPVAEPVTDVDPLLALGLPHRAAVTGPDGPDGPDEPHQLHDPHPPAVVHLVEEAQDPSEAGADDPDAAPEAAVAADPAADDPEPAPAPATPILAAVPDMVDHELPEARRHAGRWDEPIFVAEDEDAEATPARPEDPNAAWLADLYSQFIDEPQTGNGKKRRRGEPNPVDVAFRSTEQDGEAKVSTLQRLIGALKKL